MFRWQAPLLVVALLALTSNAFADLVSSPPSDCPRGAIGETSHTGTWCGPRACQSDADCKRVWGGTDYVEGRCETTSLCLQRKMVPGSRRVFVPDAGSPMFERTYAVGTCDRDGTCEAGDAKCETAQRCVVASAAPVSSAPTVPTESKRGCGCGKTTAAPKTNALVGVLVALWLLRRSKARG